MQRLLWTLVASTLATGAVARPSPSNKAAIREQTSGVDAAMTLAARKAWRAGLRAGRKAHLAKDFPAAVAAFTRALEAFPDDPRALVERGWAKFQGGDLAGAAADTESALKRASDPKLRASALYNLGRVHEAKGDVPAAIQAWQASLALRPHEAVSSRLAKLAGQKPTGPLEPRPLLGPFADEAALCAALRTEAHLGPDLRCQRGAIETPVGAASGGKAYIAAGVLPLFEDEERPPAGPAWVESIDIPGEAYYHLVVTTPAGLFVQPAIAEAYNPGAFGISAEAQFKAARAETLPGGQVAWVIEIEESRSDSDMGINEVEFWTAASVAICGVGPSGKPSCVGPLTTRIAHSRELLTDDEPQEPGEPPMQHDLWDRKAALDAHIADGVLTLKVAESKDMEPPMRALVGQHRIALP